MVNRFEMNFIHSKSDTVSLICDQIVSWSIIDLQWQQAGKDHMYIPPEYNDGLDIKQQHKILLYYIIIKTHHCMMAESCHCLLSDLMITMMTAVISISSSSVT